MSQPDPAPTAPSRAEPLTGPGATTFRPMRAPGGYQTYRRKHTWAWWNSNRHYQIYMLRELSAIFHAIWAVHQIRQLKRLSEGERSYNEYVRSRRGPGWALFNAVGSGFALLHAFTWWRLLGGLDLVKIGDRKAPADKVTLGAFGGWGLISALLALVLLFGGRRGRWPDRGR